MNEDDVKIAVVVNETGVLLIFPAGEGPKDPNGNPKPILGFGLERLRPAVFVMHEYSVSSKAEFYAFLPLQGMEYYYDIEKVLVAEVDELTSDVKDRGWMRAIDLFKRHIRKNTHVNRIEAS
jgi:hypothetical protein